jgi:uncharacterized protein
MSILRPLTVHGPALALALALAGPTPVAAQLQPRTAATALRGAPTPAPTYRSIKWDALVAPGWDAYQGVRRSDIDELDDSDPRAAALLKRLREHWDNAPVNMSLVGQPVRIAGYIVPLESGKQGLSEFLLVPSFGACIHTPAPPSNQIIHVVPRIPPKGFRTMDTVWISGVLKYERNDSGMGRSSWRVEAVDVEGYAAGATQPLR